MIYANINVYTNDKEETGVLTRTGPYGYNIFLQTYDPNDVSINMDNRLIEFYLRNPDNQSYEEWDVIMNECGYPSLLKQDFPDLFENDDADTKDELSMTKKLSVPGFMLWWVPTGKMFRIVYRDHYEGGRYIETRQEVEICDEDDFIKT